MLGIVCGLAIVIAFILGSVYGKSIKIEVNHAPKFEEEEFLEQPQILDPAVQKYFDENGGFKF